MGIVSEPLAAEPSKTPLGEKIEDFSLRDFRGKQHALSDYAGSKLVVVAFVGNDCPVAKLFAPRLQKLSREFASQQVSFVAINSNSQDSLTGVAAFARIHELEFPVLKDPGNEVADRFGAIRTPEVFVLDPQRVVRYHGRVDDQYLVGLRRTSPTREDLRLAIQELLAGKEVSVPEAPAVGCHIGRAPKPSSEGNLTAGAVTYSDQIARLFQDRCVSCHRDGEIAPFPLTSYREVVGWGETIREVVDQGRMPPWLASPAYGHFANEARLSDAEKRLISDWLAAGSPEGDPARLPPPREFTAGWQIPKPDQVIFMREAPFDVPAEGTVAYQYFTVDPGFKEDRWIQYAEARPGNPAVVHHIVASFIPPGARERVSLNGPQVGFAPGIPPIRLPEGTAMFVPAGSQMLFQMHYTPNGSPQKDRSMVGLVFADPARVRQRVDGGAAANVAFQIPAGDDNYEVVSKFRFNRDARLYSLMPHMHVRGKAFRYEALYPDGRREVLLDVPRYDFNWQLRYQLAEPKPLPKGTELICTAHFDNSAGNLANPNPNQPVRWGDQTWQEMMIGYFSTISPRESANPSGAELSPVTIRDDAESRQKAKELVRLGVEALGGAKRLAESPVVSFKIKGTVFVSQSPMAFIGTTVLDAPGGRLSLKLQGLAFKFAVVLDGEHCWIKPGEQTIELPREGLEEQRERVYAENVARLQPLLDDDGYQFRLITDGQIADRAADAVVVRRPGHRDVRLYFDPATHLLGKTEIEIMENGRMLAQEVLWQDYAEFDGVQRPRKAVVRWDGTERLQREMSDYRATSEAPADAFAKP
jgi:peroxiredoxin/mono/diheme cytochrome c family protein